MAQEFKPGQIVPESGIYSISHDPHHPDMPHEVTVIKGAVSRHAGAVKGSVSSWCMRRSTSARCTTCKRMLWAPRTGEQWLPRCGPLREGAVFGYARNP
jgi:hypothetical protein